MRILVLFFILIFFSNLGLLSFANSDCENIINVSSYREQYLNSDKLSYLEFLYFGRNFPTDSTLTRIKRLELRVFKRIQSGSLFDRTARLVKYTSNLYSYKTTQPKMHIKPRYYRNQNVYPYNTFTKTRAGIKNISKIIFGGAPTGFTPPITYTPQKYEYNNPIHTDNMLEMGTYENENEYIDNYGNAYLDYESIGTKTGIQIID